MKNILMFTLILLTSVLLSGCDVKKETTIQNKDSVEPTPTTEIKTVSTDPIEIFLIKLTENTKIPFSGPVKADIFWREGESTTSLKTFFGDSFLIEYLTPKEEDEKTIENYFKENNFTYMKFNESRGDDSHKVGYRKDNLVCKYDWSKYPDEEVPHLIVYCTDSNNGTERK